MSIRVILWFSSTLNRIKQTGISELESVGAKFWSAGTAALFRCPQGPRCVGRRKERRGSWAYEEAVGGGSPALGGLRQHRSGHPGLAHCRLKHLRWLTHLESCSGVGRTGFFFFFNNLYFFLAVCLRCSVSFCLAAMRRGSSGVGGLLIAMASLVAEPGL